MRVTWSASLGSIKIPSMILLISINLDKILLQNSLYHLPYSFDLVYSRRVYDHQYGTVLLEMLLLWALEIVIISALPLKHSVKPLVKISNLFRMKLIFRSASITQFKLSLRKECELACIFVLRKRLPYFGN